MTIKRVATKLSLKLSNLKQSISDWFDDKVTNFVMEHLNLEETILCAITKAARGKLHLASFLLVVAYYGWRFEVWLKSLFARKSKDPRVIEIENA